VKLQRVRRRRIRLKPSRSSPAHSHLHLTITSRGAASALVAWLSPDAFIWAHLSALPVLPLLGKHVAAGQTFGRLKRHGGRASIASAQQTRTVASMAILAVAPAPWFASNASLCCGKPRQCDRGFMTRGSKASACHGSSSPPQAASSSYVPFFSHQLYTLLYGRIIWLVEILSYSLASCAYHIPPGDSICRIPATSLAGAGCIISGTPLQASHNSRGVSARHRRQALILIGGNLWRAGGKLIRDMAISWNERGAWRCA